MPELQPDLTARAEALMQEQRFAEAIQAFDTHLARQPADPKALLQLGICHLLDRSEEVFLDIYQRAQGLLGTLREIPEEIARLWSLYRSLVAKVTATALVASTVGLTACDKTEPLPDPAVAPPSTGATETAEPSAEPSAEPTATAEPAPSASATATATAAATATPAPPPPATTTTRPAHRYSGGVIPKPTPAHRYSAGVRRSPSPDGAS